MVHPPWIRRSISSASGLPSGTPRRSLTSFFQLFGPIALCPGPLAGIPVQGLGQGQMAADPIVFGGHHCIPAARRLHRPVAAEPEPVPGQPPPELVVAGGGDQHQPRPLGRKTQGAASSISQAVWADTPCNHDGAHLPRRQHRKTVAQPKLDAVLDSVPSLRSGGPWPGGRAAGRKPITLGYRPEQASAAVSLP